MGNTPFIAVEGPIGVGKTSLAQAISRHFHIDLLKEIVDENPFLNKFYQNREEWSFQTEMFFLCNRFKQLEDTERVYLQKGRPVVADYHVLKNLIFAKRTLRSDHYEKYKRIFSILTHDKPQPSLIIYLSASLDRLLSRIEMRGRKYEQNMDQSYLLQLSKDYDECMADYESRHPEVTVLRFNGDDLDFVKRKEDLDYIIRTIQPNLPKGAFCHGSSL